MLHTNTVENDTLELLKSLNEVTYLNDFFLVGGTALSLQIGHRKSIDLDFFSTQSFDESSMANKLVNDFKADILSINTNSISGEIQGIKFDLLSHQYSMIENPKNIDSIRLASLPDISAMKINAIENRGSKKDFVDIFYLLKTFTLPEIIDYHQIKYPKREYIIALKSLMYFEDAEPQPDCDLIVPQPWSNIKKKLEVEVLKLI